VRQNYETSSAEVLEQRGQPVEVGWLPQHAVPIGEGTETEERDL
jgi:hypothetical protein